MSLPSYYAVDCAILGEHTRDLGFEGYILPRPRRRARRIPSLRGMLMIGGWGDRQNAADRLAHRQRCCRALALGSAQELLDTFRALERSSPYHPGTLEEVERLVSQNLGCYAMDDAMDLLRQAEGVQLLQKASPTGGVFMIRTLRARVTWHLDSEAGAIQIYEDEVAKSRDCQRVQKLLGSF